LTQQIKQNIDQNDQLSILLNHQNELLKNDMDYIQSAYYSGLMDQTIFILDRCVLD